MIKGVLNYVFDTNTTVGQLSSVCKFGKMGFEAGKMSKLVVDVKEETIRVNYESAGYVAILNHCCHT